MIQTSSTYEYDLLIEHLSYQKKVNSDTKIQGLLLQELSSYHFITMCQNKDSTGISSSFFQATVQNNEKN